MLKFDKFPFYIGALESSENKGLPLVLPFTLEYDSEAGIIAQKYSEEIDATLVTAYTKGSLLSTGLGSGSFGMRRADDVLRYLLKSCPLPIEKASFLEIGCGDGFLLHRLKQLGAKKVIGCEPGPAALQGMEKYGVKILNRFFEPALFDEKYDVIYSYGVLEHIYNPLKLLSAFKYCLKENGHVFVGVPNCEKKLKLGDANILCHEHWNYFTEENLRNLLARGNFDIIEMMVGINDAMIYAWGTVAKEKGSPIVFSAATERLFEDFCARVKKILSILQKRVNMLSGGGKSLGLYGGGIPIIGLLEHDIEPRFFDSDIAKHGKYFPGYNNPIENPENMLSDGVDELWIIPIDYDEEIRDYLKNRLQISDRINVLSMKQLFMDIV